MKTLSDVCDVYSGYALKEFNDSGEGLPVIKIGNIMTDGSLALNDCQYTSEVVNDKYYSKEGDIYVALSGATTGKIGILESSSIYIINQRVGVIRRKDDNIPNEYIKYFLLRQTDRMLKEAAGCAQPNISPKQIAVYEFPEISKKKMLEESYILDEITLVISQRKNELQQLDNLIKARFVEMFGKSDYPKTTIGNLVDGKVSSAKKDFSQNDRIKYIDISSIDNKRNIMTGYKEYVFSQAPSRAQQHIIQGDIVVSTVRPNLRNVAITIYPDNNLVASSGFCVLRATKCLPSYLMAIVCSDEFTDAMSKVVTGANYPAIKDSNVTEYTVAIPPLELQQQFDLFVRQVDKSKAVVQKALDQAQLLFDSLMQKYFG